MSDTLLPSARYRQAAVFACAGFLGGLSLEERERALDAAASVIARVAAEEALRVAERAFRGAVTALHETGAEVASWVASQIACRWISVEERLPGVGVRVLVLHVNGQRSVGWENGRSGDWWSEAVECASEHAEPDPGPVVYWQPLPGDPIAKGGTT